MDLTESLDQLWRLWVSLFPAGPERQTIAVIFGIALMLGVGQAMKTLFGAK